MSTAIRNLQIEAEAARRLLSSLAEVIGEDDELAATTVEGETNLLEALDRALVRLLEVEGMVAGLTEMASSIKTRRDRLQRQHGTIRGAIQAALEVAHMRRAERPLATISIRALPNAIVVVNPDQVPMAYWRQPDPIIDLAAIREASTLEEVPGTEMISGRTSMTIRFS